MSAMLFLIAVLFVLTLISGIRLRLAGTPYSNSKINFHKLFSLGLIVLLGAGVYRKYDFSVFNTLEGVWIITTTFTVMVAFLTGGIMSYQNTRGLGTSYLHRLSTIGLIVFGGMLVISLTN